MNYRKLKIILKDYDWILIFTIVALVFIGLISLLSTSQSDLTNFYKQIIWLVLGLVAMFLFSLIDYRLFRVHSFPVLFIYFLGIAGLVAVHFLADPIRGAKSWIILGPINIEPVEILKIILILILAKYFSMRHVEMYRMRHIVISGFYILLPAVFLILQPDLGSLAVLAAIWIGVLMVSGIKLKHLAILGVLGLFLAVFAWSFLLVDYQKIRMSSFMNPQSDPFGSGYNSIQAQIAVASGGVWGKGFSQGTQSQLGFLPEVQTDFIYAAIAEEFGFLISSFLLLLYGVFFWRIMKIIPRAIDNFARLTIMGFSIMIAVQLFSNIAMTLGLLPITGLTLPFVSYGGSSLISLFIAIGIIQSIYIRSSLAIQA